MAMGQSVSLRFDTVLDCVTAEYCATLQIRNDSSEIPLNIGSSSIFFSYNADALVYKSYESLHFDGSDLCLLDVLSAWSEHGIDVSNPGIVNITLNLQYSPTEEEASVSCPSITNEWTDISEICFTVVPNSDTLDLWFSEDQGLVSFNNYYPNNGTLQLPEGTHESETEIIDCIMMLPPVAIIDSIMVMENDPFTFTFYGENSFDEDGTVAAYYWDFGDGTTALGINAQHTYMESGNYIITLEVVDNDGLTHETMSTMQVVETIVEVSSPNAIITVSPYNTSSGPTNVTLDAYQSTTPNGEITYHEWYLNNISISGNDFIEVYLIDEASYEIVLQVTDEANMIDTDTAFLQLISNDCDTAFVFEESVLYEAISCSNTPINLNNSINNLPDNAVWTNAEGNEILNPTAYAMSYWGCEAKEALLTVDYTFFNQENCELRVHQDQLMLEVYASIAASVAPLDQACGVQLSTCPDYVVTWTDDTTSGNGAVYYNTASTGQVNFTVSNPNAPNECNTKTYVGFNYCTTDLEVHFQESAIEVQLNESFEATLIVANKGELPVNNIYLGYTQEESIGMLGMISSDFTGVNNQWFLSTLAPGEERQLTVTLIPQSMGELTFDVWLAAADGEDADSYAGNTDLSEDDMDQLSITAELIDCNELCPQPAICIAPITPAVLCPTFCTLDTTTTINILEYNSLFDCTIEVSFNNCLVYLPIPGMENAEMPDQLTVIAEDGNGLCEIVVYTITVGACLLPPIAENDYIVVLEDIAILPVLDNDSDPNGDDIYVCGIASQPNFGEVTLVNGVLSYEPNEGFTGSDLFTYEVCDDMFSSAAIVYLIVEDTACETDNQSACVSPGETITLCPNFCGFDELNNIDVLTASSGGFLVNLDNGCFRYRPLETYEGNEEVLAVTCLSQQNFCDTVRYSIQVSLGCQPNNSNIAYLTDDYDTTLINTPIFIDVLANDDLPLNQNIAICQITGLNQGTAEITVNQQIAFTPAEDYVGALSFSYILCDGVGNETATGFVFVEVLESLNDCMIYREICTKPLQAIEICLDFCAPTLSVSAINTTFNCGISQLTSNCFRYQPLPGLIGTDTINIVYCDENGSCFSGKIDVHINQECDGERLLVSPDCNPRILNVLTPNNDGVNDLWLVDEQFNCLEADYVKVEIFDRYGVMICVQENDALENGWLIWNGQYENTLSHVPEGVYFYKINIEQKNSLTIRTGFIEVRR